MQNAKDNNVISLQAVENTIEKTRLYKPVRLGFAGCTAQAREASEIVDRGLNGRNHFTRRIRVFSGYKAVYRVELMQSRLV